MLHRNLYNIDSKGKTRVWSMESEGNKYRTYSGILDGKIVISEWTSVEGKNIGKSNETSPEQQALSEVESTYENKLARKYSDVMGEAKRSNIFQPMLAATYKAGKTKDRNYMWQPKLDGVRCALKPEGGFSREGKPFFTIQHIIDQMPMIHNELVFDGELYNHELKDDFDKLVSMIRQQKIEELSDKDLAEIREKVQYHVYDVFDPTEPNRPFIERQKFLKTALLETDRIKLVPTGEIPDLSTMEDKHGECIELGYEGIMLRIPESPYDHKRSKNLIKHKNFMTEEFTVVDIESGIGNWEGIAKKVVLRLPDGRVFKSGIDGSMEKNQQRLICKDAYISGDALCRFQNYTPDGIPRFGVVKYLYGSKRDL